MPQPHPYKEALEAYANPFHELEIQPLTGGLINLSYKVTSKSSGESFLLQQINDQVFLHPPSLQSNYEKLWNYLQEHPNKGCIPAPRYFPDESTLFRDGEGRFWRVFEFIGNSTSLETASNAGLAKKVAAIFACFTRCFSHFDIRELVPTIDGFHDLSARYQQFEHAMKESDPGRLKNATGPVAQLIKKKRYVHFYEVITESDEFRKRVTHHDAKISNVLFDRDSFEVICPVDIDTAMPGYFFSDLGDMIRSMASCKDEHSTELDDICIREEYYDAILEGYLEEMEPLLTASEKKYIHFAGLMMVYMQALRFMTDYLENDRYYKINYNEQNYDRTVNQLVLLEKLEEFLSAKYDFRI